MKVSRYLSALIALLALTITVVGVARPAAANSVTALIPKQLTLGQGTPCALDQNGAAWCWGRNDVGQVGDGTTTSRSVPTAVTGGLTFTVLSAGGTHVCGLISSGVAYCWGDGNYGELGNGANGNVSTPTLVSGSHTFTSLAAGGNVTCGLVSGGAAYCWGENFSGQLGTGSTGNQNTPQAVTGGAAFASISVGYSSVCGVSTGGTSYCWGDNGWGQVGDGSTTNRYSPTALTGGIALVKTFSNAGFGYHNCGLTSAGKAYCWGRDQTGELGDNTSSYDHMAAPTPVYGNLTFQTLSVGSYDACGLTTAGASYCWGYEPTYQLGDGSNGDSNVPVATSTTGRFTSIAAGDNGTCAMNATTIYCWGDNTYGQIGNNTASTATTPTQVWTFSTANSVAVTFTVDPYLTFAIAGLNSGSCNGAALTATNSTATAVPLGHVSSLSNAVAGQTLTLSSNAANGYTVYVKYSGTVSDGNGHTIANSSGTNGSPTTFSGAGTAAFGYTTDHGLSGTATRFQTNKWAALSTSNAEVIYQSAPAAADVGHVCYQEGVSVSTPAAAYSTTATYTAVPTF